MKRQVPNYPVSSKEKKTHTQDATRRNSIGIRASPTRHYGETSGGRLQQGLTSTVLTVFPEKVRFAAHNAAEISHDPASVVNTVARTNIHTDARHEAKYEAKRNRRDSRKTELRTDSGQKEDIQVPVRQVFRKSFIRPSDLDMDTYLRRKETIDGGVLKELVEFLKTKTVDLPEDPDDVFSSISLAQSSGSTLQSLPAVAETSPNDPHSFSRCDLVYIESLEIHWNVCFDKQMFDGDVVMKARRRKPGSTTLSLDTFFLDIKSVKVNGISSNYVLFPHKTELGSRMDIELPDSQDQTYDVYIKYYTNPKAPGLQWLKSDLKGMLPFVFSHCESIQCRSIIPIQDTPGNKVKYTARVTAPTNMKVVMSSPKERQHVMLADGRSTYYFRQDVSVAPYLIAIAVGNLASAKVGERTTVWALPEYIDSVKRVFGCTKDLLSIAETICGSYRWDKYDVLVLPPSESNVSAMAHPSLTFFNPSLVTGDGSMTNYIAHEIAHSWAGNMVTHANYEHLWITEGFANFIGRKILGKRYGQEARLFAASRGFKDMQMVIDIYGRDHPLTCLVADLKERKPREAVLIVPYEKGHTLLYYLELLIEDMYAMDQYIKEYIATFKDQSINSYMFRTHFLEFFSQSPALKNIDWNTWFYAPGTPPFRPDYHTSLEETCSTLKEMWLKWKIKDKCPFSEVDLNVMSIMQILDFLSQMLASPPLPEFKLETMDKLYKFDQSENLDARLKWYLLCLRGHWREKVEPAVAFAIEDGRQFCVLAVFHELNQWDAMRQGAITTFFRMKTAISNGTMRILAALLRVDPTEEHAAMMPVPGGRRRTIVNIGKYTDKRSEDVPSTSTRRRSTQYEEFPNLNIRRKSVFPHSRRQSNPTTSNEADKRPQ